MTAIFRYEYKTISADDILIALRASGITTGDTVYVHSALTSFGRLAKGVKRAAFTGAFIDALREAIGATGNLLMPTFSYSFCKREAFDIAKTPSTVGLLTEAYRQQSGVRRTAEGIFSSALEGPDADYYLDVAESCFGTQSIFEKMYDRDAKFVFLGETFDLTFIHFVEQRMGVPYRYIKAFPGTTVGGQAPGNTNPPRETVAYYNVRYLDANVEYDMDKLAASMHAAGLVQTAPLGASSIRTIKARDTFDHIYQGIRADLGFLLTQSPTLPAHAIVQAEPSPDI